jgi:hypothetical protein
LFNHLSQLVAEASGSAYADSTNMIVFAGVDFDDAVAAAREGILENTKFANRRRLRQSSSGGSDGLLK